jgi:hypothetical protein
MTEVIARCPLNKSNHDPVPLLQRQGKVSVFVHIESLVKSAHVIKKRSSYR